MTTHHASNRASDINNTLHFITRRRKCDPTKLTRRCSHAPTQADVVTYKAFSAAPDAAKYPHVARWYQHIASYESEFASLPGDPTKAYTTYGPETTDLPTNPKDKPADDDDMDDLFGSDEDEEEDPEVVKEREARLAEYKKKKEGKAKPAAKSIVTLDVKPWGECFFR
jgi:elongation factor 1-beta